MPIIDFKSVKEELDEAEHMHIMQVLVRGSLTHGADNRPYLLIMTDKVIYWGGTPDLQNRFNRIPISSVMEAAIAGRYMWESIKLTHMEIEGERTVYITPFKGDYSRPEKDAESMDLILGRLCDGKV